MIDGEVNVNAGGGVLTEDVSFGYTGVLKLHGR
jgi:hypothetical protein